MRCWRMKQHFLVFAVIVGVTVSLTAFRLIGQPSVTSTIVEPIEPTPLEIAASEVEKGLNRFFPLLSGSIFDSIPFDQANRTASTTNSDNDAFLDCEVYDFGTVDDDGYGGIVKICDEGSVLKYVFENFQTPSETWTGWITSPDTDQFPSGNYAWELSVQTPQETEQWQGSVTVAQQATEKFALHGTLQLSDAQGDFQLTVSNTNPLLIDATQPALLSRGGSTLTFTEPNGVARQGAWTVLNIGVSRLWIDENNNNSVDNGETVDINYDAQTGTWKVATLVR